MNNRETTRPGAFAGRGGDECADRVFVSARPATCRACSHAAATAPGHRFTRARRAGPPEGREPADVGRFGGEVSRQPAERIDDGRGPPQGPRCDHLATDHYHGPEEPAAGNPDIAAALNQPL